MKYIYGNSINMDWFQIESLDSDYESYSFTDNQNRVIVYLNNGISSIKGWSVFLEEYVKTLVPTILSSVIPMFSAYLKMMSHHYVFFSNIGSYVLLKSSYHEKYIESLYQNYTNSPSNYTKLFVGHSIGGYVVKEISRFTTIEGISFESLQSTSSHSKFLQLFKSGLDANKKKTSKLISNVYSEYSMIGGFDSSFSQNIMYPFYSSANNPYESFCMTVAQCSQDDRYVPMCKQYLSIGSINGTQKYLEMVNNVRKLE